MTRDGLVVMLPLLLACGDFSAGGGDDGGGAASDDAGAADAGGEGAATGDGAGTESGAEACAREGDVRACTASNGAKGAQTCVMGATSQLAWGACWSLACDGTASTKPDEACVPAGTFTMGGLDGDAGPVETDTLPAHDVHVRRRFYVEKWETTFDELMAWWNAHPRPEPPDGTLVFVDGAGDRVTYHAPAGGLVAPGTDKGSGCIAGLGSSAQKGQYAINCVPFETALAWCMSRGRRLPTEAEWEYVATGQGAGNEYPWGDSPAPDCSHAIFTSCAWPVTRGSCTVGNTPQGQVNAMAGDEAEWTLDFYPFGCHQKGTCWPSYADDPVDTTDDGQGLVVRGGSYLSDGSGIRARARDSLKPGDALLAGNVGVRCVRDER